MSTEIQQPESRQRQHALLIKNLIPGLAECGKIKVGIKGKMITSAKGAQFQPPQKLDHFLVTTLERGPDGNFLRNEEVHKMYGDKPRVLPVRLVYNALELNFQSRYVAFKGKTLWCAGDGEQAGRMNGKERVTRPCPCPLQDPTYEGTPEAPRCKVNGTLSVMIDGVARVGGVFKVRTTSYNSVVGITSSLSLISTLTAGFVAGLPLDLTLRPKTAIIPTTGQSMLVWVVGLEYRGSVQDLQQIAFSRAKDQALFMGRMEQIEVVARKLIAKDPTVIDNGETQEIIEEFYPEQVQVVDVETKPATAPPSPATAAAPETQAKPSMEAKPDPSPDPSQLPPPQQPGTSDVPPAGHTPPQGVTPPQQQNAGQETNVDGKGRRRRTKRFEVDPVVYGKGTIVTCGSTPEQLLELKGIIRKDRSVGDKIRAALAAIGYTELSYLTHPEAEGLIAEYGTRMQTSTQTDPEPSQAAANSKPAAADEEGQAELTDPPYEAGKVFCKKDGDMVNREWCSTYCDIRKRDGFCLYLGEEPPNAGGLI